MSMCGCPDAGCDCVIRGGTGIAVTGTGEDTDPYVIATTTSAASVTAGDTQTIAMTAANVPGGRQISGTVRADPGGGIVAGPDGLSVKTAPAPNALSVTASGLSVTPGAVTVDPAGAIVTGGSGLRIKPDPASPAAVAVSAAGLRVTPDLSGINTRIDYDFHMQRMARFAAHPGTMRISQSHIAFGQIACTMPMEQQQQANFYYITMPAAGTVIGGLFGASNVTVVTTQGDTCVPLGDWQALWYLVPTTSSSSASLPANFRISSYTANGPRLPDNAVLIAFRSGWEDKEVHWCTGEITVPWRVVPDVLRGDSNGAVNQGPAVNLGSNGSQRVSYRRVNGMWEIQGVYAWAGTGIASPGGKDLYQQMPFAAPTYDTSRTQWDRNGTGKLWTAANADVRGYALPLVPTLLIGSSRIYWEVPATPSAAYVERLRIWDGSNGIGTGRPILTRPVDTPGSVLTFELRVPIGSLPQS